MAIGTGPRSCTVVLHDDRLSDKDVLGGTDVLPVGSIARLSAGDAQAITVISEGRASGQKEVSLHIRLGTRFGFENRTAGKLWLIENDDDVTATYVDFVFRDQHLSRADLWMLSKQLDARVIYRSSNVDYLGNMATTARAIYAAGHEVNSALVQQAKTKAIFRSHSARYTILIQISREMLETWHESDLLYETLINGYLTELFHRWESLKVRHLVSVVLFGRRATLDHDDKTNHPRDFYHVVHLNLPSNRYPEILRSLKRVFYGSTLPRQISLAANGNILQAIHLSAMDFLMDTETPYLTSTGTSLIIVTAGNGSFDADHRLLNKTTNVLLGNSIGVDIVSLAPKPLHPVPLFKYQLANVEEFAIPHWADISYWLREHFDPETSLPGLGDLAQTTNDVAIPRLVDSPLSATHSASRAMMDAWDDSTFDASHLQDPKKIKMGTLRLEGTSAESNRTVKALSIHQEHTPRSTLPLPAPLKHQQSSSSIVTTKSSGSRSQLPTQSLLSKRKISVGPRGLAPMKSTASTTISSAYASHGREPPLSPKAAVNEVPSDLAKQIRASLNRKPSQQSLGAQSVSPDVKATQPIDIQTTQPAPSEPGHRGHTPDNKHELASSNQGHVSSPSSPSKTPKAFDALTSSPEKHRSDRDFATTTPWLTLRDPCNLKPDNMRVASQYRQWQHVFPKAIDSAAFKWTSMCSPAVLPLYNDLQPSLEHLKAHYKKSTRRIVCSQVKDNAMRPIELMKRLIILRLARGFQIVARPHHSEDMNVILSIGPDYHQIQCLSDIELEIIEYIHRTTASATPVNQPVLSEVTSWYAQTPTETSLAHDHGDYRVDWAAVDQSIESHSPEHSLFRMRFVLLPLDRSRGSPGTLAMQRDLSDDEKRIDGIQRLTQQWQRHRVFVDDGQGQHVSVTRRGAPTASEDEWEQNPLAIEYHTRDPSALINSQEGGMGGGLVGSEALIPLFPESERYLSSNFDIVKLVRQMQEAPPQGIEVRDRRWLARLHLKCFRGDEMTNWLLSAFKDLRSREDAVHMGNELMNRGIFTHVRHKHAFRDGHYFYQISGPYRTVEYPDTASLFNRVPGRSVPATPISEARMSPVVRPARGDSDSSGEKSMAGSNLADKRQVLLSQVLRYDVDQSKKSDREEIINLHYDRVHNPEHCYHIHIDWLLTTPTLIREAVSRWSTLVESYGLRLVQVPLLEACEHSKRHPLEQPQYVKLALEPPDRVPSTPHLGVPHALPRFNDDRRFYLKVVLRRLGFILDYESANSYADYLDVSFSWGELDFKLTQYVHRTGLVLAQISANKEWDLLLLPNRLAADRGQHTVIGRANIKDSAEDILKAVTSLAKDPKALRLVYEEANKPRIAAPSPFARAVQANADSDVPPMQLPPHLLNRVQ